MLVVRPAASGRCRRGRSAGSASRTGRCRTARDLPLPRRHRLRLEVDLHLPAGRVLGARDQAVDAVLRQLDREQADLRAVVAEDVGERRRDDRLAAPCPAAPTARARARSRSRSSGRSTRIWRAVVAVVVQDEVRVLAPRVERELAEAGALDALQVLRRDDLVRVDVRARQRQDLAAGSCVTGSISSAPTRGYRRSGRRSRRRRPSAG